MKIFTEIWNNDIIKPILQVRQVTEQILKNVKFKVKKEQNLFNLTQDY